jgi:hypothetical protein
MPWTLAASGSARPRTAAWSWSAQAPLRLRPLTPAQASSLGLTLIEQPWLGVDASTDAASPERTAFVADAFSGDALDEAEAAECAAAVRKLHSLMEDVPLDAPWLWYAATALSGSIRVRATA